MSDPATSNIEPYYARNQGSSTQFADQPAFEGISSQAADTSPLPVLARVPQLNSSSVLGIETPQFRVDSTPTQSAPYHHNTGQDSRSAASEIGSDIFDQSEETTTFHSAHDKDSEQTAGESTFAEVALQSSTKPNSSPIQTLRQMEMARAEKGLAEFMLRLQLMFKPLARAVLLAALLTASALAYLLLENKQVPLAPVNHEQFSPEFNAEPRLTSKPIGTSVIPQLNTQSEETLEESSAPEPPSILKQPTTPALTMEPTQPLSAIGPGGGAPKKIRPIALKQPTKEQPQLVAKSPRTDVVAPAAVALSQVEAEPQVDTKPPVETQPTSTVLPAYAQTDYPVESITPIGTKLNPPVMQPPEVARLTGSIQEPIAR